MDTHQVGHGEEFDLFTAEITDLWPCMQCGSSGIFMDKIQGIQQICIYISNIYVYIYNIYIYIYSWDGQTSNQIIKSMINH